MYWKPALVAAAVAAQSGLVAARVHPIRTTTTTKPAKTSSSTATSTHSAATNYFITFGDSYSQTGFNISSTPPTPGNILGNPAFPGYTTANGNQSNWIDDLISVHNKTTLLSYNFAWGGATTDADLIAGYEPYPQVLSFIDQVSQFTSAIPKGPWTPSNTLFGIWMGVNDVGNGWYQSNWSTLVTEVLQKYFEEVQILYNSGARNFVFLTVPPITLTPNVQASADANSIAQEAAAIVTYSNLLVSSASNFSASNSGVKYSIFNTTTPFMTALNNPTAYGAVNSTCYDSTGLECLWFNDYHPGAAIQALVADGVAKQVGSPWFV